jgi:hypothetical protein
MGPLVERDARFEPGFLASPQVSQSSVPRFDTAFRASIRLRRLPRSDVLLVFVHLTQACLPLTLSHLDPLHSY